MLKAGLNFSDVNRAKRLLEAGYTFSEASRDVRCLPEVLERRFNEDGSEKGKEKIEDSPKPKTKKKTGNDED